jgi:HAD superfamily hydrolase (TIGR01549 family)
MNKKNLPWIKDIKVLVWDLDQTLYPYQKALDKEFKKALYQIVAEYTNTSYQKAKKQFQQRQKKLKGTTITLNSFGIDGYQQLPKIVKAIDWSKYLKKEKRLTQMFNDLKSYRHLLLSDSNREIAIMKLELLGLDISVFEKTFCGIELRITKPNIKLFKKVSLYTKLPAKCHLIIGDSLDKDILPAKKLGWQTCLVWKKSNKADINLPTVYDMIGLFT